MRHIDSVGFGRLLFLACALLFSASSILAECAQIDPITLLPEDEICPTWIKDGDPQTAYTYEQLTEIINGGAGLYWSYGFVAAAFQNYAGEIAATPAAATLAVFNQGTAQNAIDLYNDPESGQGDPILDWSYSGEARVRAAFGIVTLQYYEECFFGSVVLIPSDETGIADARCLAEAVCEMIQGAVPTDDPTWGQIKSLFK